MSLKAIVLFRACLCAAFVLSGASWTRAGEVVGRTPERSASQGLAHYMMAVHYDLLGMVPEAVREYSRSVHYEDSAYVPHVRLGMNYARSGRYAEAASELTTAITLNPEDIQSHYFLALIYSAQKDLVRAAEEYEKILRKFSDQNPKNAELFVYLGQLYYSQGRADKAMEQFARVLALEPDNADIMYLVGSYYLETDRRDEGVGLLKQCVAKDPFAAGCLNSLSYAYAEDGVNLEEAADMIHQALQIDPDNGAYLDTLAWVYYRQGMFIEALKELNRAAGQIEDPVIYDHMGDIYRDMDQRDMARKYWRMSLGLDPDQPLVKNKLESLDQERAQNVKENN